MGSRTIACAASLMFVVGACGADDEPATTAPPPGRATTVYVIDSDGAFDDLKAIVYMLQRPDVEVRALTMSGTGVAHCPQGAENAAAVLARLDVTGIPVACGRETPLVGHNEAPAQWRANADTLGGMTLPKPGELSDLAAPDLLIDTIRSSPTKVTVLALGPLTNIAEAIHRNRTLLDNVEMIYVMGGAVDVGGNVSYANETAEFNIWADPHAAALVLESGVPITLVPLDATNAAPVTPRFYEVFAKHRGSPAAAFIGDYLAANPLFGGIYHWDELTAVAATDESIIDIQERKLAIVETDGPDQGRTVEQDSGRTVRVAVSADRRMFEDRFFSAILGRQPTDVPDWQPDAVLTWDGERCTYDGPKNLPRDVVVQLNNLGSQSFGLVTGTNAPGTTKQDLIDWQASKPTQPPPWWTQLGLWPAPPGARDVWVVGTGGEDVAVLCYVDVQRFWQVAGPMLPE